MTKNLKYIFWISGLTYFLQSVENLPNQALFCYFKNTLHLPPPTIMNITCVISLVWILKMLWGYLIDNFLTKKTWYILALLLSVICFSCLGTYSLPLIFLIGLLCFSNLATSFRDVGIDGIVCVEGKETNLCGELQSCQWLLFTIGALIVGLLGGFAAQINNYKMGYLCLLPLYIFALIIILNYKETKIRNYKLSFKETILQYKQIFKDKRFLIACGFMFLYCYSPSFGTPLDFIVRDSFKWSEVWIGTLRAITEGFSLIGAVLYWKYSKTLNTRKWLVWSVYIGAFTALAYLYFTPATAIIYGIAFAIVGMFVHLILMNLVANITLKGMETVTFALLCSIHNAAGTCSLKTGAWLLPKIGLQPLIIVAAFTSFLCLPLINHLQLEKLNES